MQTAAIAEKPRKQAISGHFWADRTYRGRIKDDHKIDLAEVTGYSLSHFKTKFHKETGITPAEYILMQKMETAKNELLQSDKSITDIAYSLGFSTSNYFSSVFRKYFETTPRDCRKSHRE